MKHLFCLFTLLFAGFCSFSQAPHALNYQTIVRSSDGNELPNQLVSLRISLNQGSFSGPSVYVETHSGTTNGFGLLNLQIGRGNLVSGSFSNVAWEFGPYFLQVELDVNGGNNFMLMGSSELLSVPYSLYANNANHALDDHDRDSTNEFQMLSSHLDTIFLTNGGFIVLPPEHRGTNTDNQTLSLNGDTLSIANGNSVILPSANGGPKLTRFSLPFTGNTTSTAWTRGINFPDFDRLDFGVVDSMILVTYPYVGNVGTYCEIELIDLSTFTPIANSRVSGNTSVITNLNGWRRSANFVNNLPNGAFPLGTQFRSTVQGGFAGMYYGVWIYVYHH